MLFTIWRFVLHDRSIEYEAHPSTEQDESLEDNATRIMRQIEAGTATAALAKFTMLRYRERAEKDICLLVEEDYLPEEEPE